MEIIVGETFGDVEVLAKVEKQLYRVRYTCCGHVTTLTATGIRNRVKNSCRCRHCQKQMHRYEVGDVVANCKVISATFGKSSYTQKYVIEYLCCGERTLITHRTLVKRRFNGSAQCRKCSMAVVHEARRQAAKEKRPKARPKPPKNFSIGPRWPKPSFIELGEAPSLRLR